MSSKQVHNQVPCPVMAPAWKTVPIMILIHIKNTKQCQAKELAHGISEQKSSVETTVFLNSVPNFPQTSGQVSLLSHL